MSQHEILALKLAKFCLLSYKNKIEKLPEKNFTIFKESQFCAYVFENDDDEECVYCVFRGTDELADTKLFFNYDICRQFCLKISLYLKTREKKIYLGGHSLGGLLAQICSTHLETIAANQTQSAVEKIVTFGSPGCRDEIKAHHDMWINSRDIIPNLSLNAPRKGKLYFIQTDKRTFFENDHSIKSYVKNLEKIVNGSYS